MASKYTKSKRTDQDIKSITKRSMEDFGEMQTDKYMDGLSGTLDMLANSPERGHEFIHGKTQRTYLYYRYVSHVIYYRKRKNDIFVTRILHTKMLPEKHL